MIEKCIFLIYIATANGRFDSSFFRLSFLFCFCHFGTSLPDVLLPKPPGFVGSRGRGAEGAVNPLGNSDSGAPWAVCPWSSCSVFHVPWMICVSCPHCHLSEPCDQNRCSSFPSSGNILGGSCEQHRGCDSITILSHRCIPAFILLITTQGWFSTFCFSFRASCKLWNFCWGGITDPAAPSMWALATMRRYCLPFPCNNSLLALFL